MRRRARGNKRAALGQRDTATVVINVQKTFQIPLSAQETSNAIAINIWEQLLTSNIFSAYAGMYDQTKIAGITAKIRGLNGSSALTLSNTPTICTAWDRNGLDTSTIAQPSDNTPIVTYTDIASYSSSIITNWSPGNAFKITRRLYPSTISEKSYYAATQSLTSSSSSRSPARDFLTIDGQNFKPILLIGAYTGFQTPVDQAVGFMIEFDITTVFRGLRKFSTIADNATRQIAAMAGSYMNGQNGLKINNVEGQAWTRVNNDGNIQSGANGETTLGNNEVPVPKKEPVTPPEPPMTTIVPFTDTITENGTYTKTAPANTAYSPINITVNVPVNPPTINITKWSMPSQVISQAWKTYPNSISTYVNMPQSASLLDIYLINEITYIRLAINAASSPDRYHPYVDNASDHRIVVFQTPGTQSNPYPLPPTPELTLLTDSNIPVISLDIDRFDATLFIHSDQIALYPQIFTVSEYPTKTNLD